MIKEQARVVTVEAGYLWAETIRKSVCGRCMAKSGCGQYMISRWAGHTTYIRALLKDSDRKVYKQGDDIVIGIPEQVLVNGALLVYMTPILGLLVGVILGQHLGNTEGVVILMGLLGFSLAAFAIRCHSYWRRNDFRVQAVVLQDGR